jgi:hypothetical protein
VIIFHFSRGADQGEPSGFDLGDITVSGDQGETTSEGHFPDQGMMIHLSLSLLLDQLASLHDTKKAVEFIGVDSSFTIWFRHTKKGIGVYNSRRALLGRTDMRELFTEALRAADEFAAAQLHLLPEDDAARRDLTASLQRFRRITGE